MSAVLPRYLILPLAAFVFGAQPFAHAAGKESAVPAADTILKDLKTGRPRLILAPDTLPGVKAAIAADPNAARWYASVKQSGEKTLDAAPSKYEIPDGKRLLATSRRVKDRVETLAFLYLMEGDRRFADRAWKEVAAAAAFKDWNPSHFLDTSEMTYGLAIALDWLYDVWTEDQRRVLREAIMKKGLEPALAVYRSEKGWHKNENNWNQVCNGGIGVGALAIADTAPDIAAEVIQRALQSLPLAMSHYAPDGAGTEGVTYWSYGTRYNILFIAALETALGTDFGLSAIPGFDLSGDYQIYLAGADRVSFNFADCGLSRMSTPQHFWMGRRFDRPQYSWYRYSELADLDGAGGRDASRDGGVFDLLWRDDRARNFDVATMPLDKHFRGAECASMRSAWGDPDALVVGIQAGDNQNLGGHRHLDLGSFILEADGVRWAIDSGTDHETYLSHQHHNPRWHYYRIRAEGHNTLVFNPAEGPDQEVKAVAPIAKFESTPQRATAVIDLSAAYAPHARRVTRTIELLDRATPGREPSVIVRDEIDAKAPADVWWFLHTEADVALGADKATATLSEKGKRLSARIVEPAGATFAVMDVAPLPTSPNPAKQASNKGRRKLAIQLPGVTRTTLTVALAPVAGATP